MPKAASAIPRALSADISANQWRNRIPIDFKDDEALRHPVPLSAAFNSSSSDGEEEGHFQKSLRQHHVWMSIQNDMQKSEEGWASILKGGKSDDSGGIPPPPYVHPMVKRWPSCLSDKSLELCTESLGSETGSDCFSFELGHRIGGEDDGDRVLKETNRFVEVNVSKYTKSPAPTGRPLPPPIPSIAGGSFRIHSHRRDGGLVLEAVSAPPKRYFHAQRGDGRLILSLIGAQSEETGGFAAEERMTMTTVLKTGPPPPPPPPPAKKWTKQNRQFSNQIHKETKESELELRVLQSLPAAPQLRRMMNSINAYEYFWRKKPGVSGGGGGLEPYCIATS